MYRFQLGYRHCNNEVEGFVGVGFSEESAYKDCWNQIMHKVAAIPNTFDEKRIIDSERSLTPNELEVIRQDWLCPSRYQPTGKMEQSEDKEKAGKKYDP
jgi:hypothetical protein